MAAKLAKTIDMKVEVVVTGDALASLPDLAREQDHSARWMGGRRRPLRGGDEVMRSYVPPTPRQSQIISEIMQLARDFNSGLIAFGKYCDDVTALWREHDRCNEERKTA